MMKVKSGLDVRAEMSAIATILGALSPLGPTQRRFVMQTVESRLALDGEVGATHPPSAAVTPVLAATAMPGVLGSPKQFMLQKNPRTDVERVACLGYYLERERGKPTFKTADISKLNADAACRRLSNPSFAIANAVRSGYLTMVSRGEKKLTAEGEMVVDALPDPEAVKRVLTRSGRGARPRRRTSSGTARRGRKA